MCLAIPGLLETITEEAPLMRTGDVNFGGIRKEVNLAYTPEAGPGDYVLVHVGFALSVIDDAEARRMFEYLDRIGEIDEQLANPD
ncbi:MAG: HypC/HybG/HupF family hydrogenase formation chaperone [Gemmatimonadetes bacterium]|nr:HypC/HybG/HupF family hydrogenase formation chaperone [Gemmatimonadota bacterium]